MRLFRYSFPVQAGIDRVWQFYTDIDHLHAITPPEVRLRVERTAPAGCKKIEQGSEAWISGNIISPLVRSRWHSQITHLSKYVYVDEMLDGGGLFKRWRHTHTFRPAASGQGTEIVDEIEFELPYGPLGKMFEGYAARRLEKIFAHRQAATASALAAR
jgi:ligand-binding SRPBCC domain-containing protein